MYMSRTERAGEERHHRRMHALRYVCLQLSCGSCYLVLVPGLLALHKTGVPRARFHVSDTLFNGGSPRALLFIGFGSAHGLGLAWGVLPTLPSPVVSIGTPQVVNQICASSFLPHLDIIVPALCDWCLLPGYSIPLNVDTITDYGIPSSLYLPHSPLPNRPNPIYRLTPSTWLEHRNSPRAAPFRCPVSLVYRLPRV